MHIYYYVGPKGAWRQQKSRAWPQEPGIQRPPNHKHKAKVVKPHHTHFNGVGKAHEAAKKAGSVGKVSVHKDDR